MSLATPYVAFVLAQAVHASGVLATVTAAVRVPAIIAAVDEYPAWLLAAPVRVRLSGRVAGSPPA